MGRWKNISVHDSLVYYADRSSPFNSLYPAQLHTVLNQCCSGWYADPSSPESTFGTCANRVGEYTYYYRHTRLWGHLRMVCWQR